MKALVTGAAGFIGGYVVQELLNAGYDVIGLDNLSKYGEAHVAGERHPGYRLIRGDAKNVASLTELLTDCDQFVAGAAMIGGITYFHAHAFDLLAENERITSASFEAAIRAHTNFRLQKITVISSSMVFENASIFPTPEGEQRRCPPPSSTYGFQKLAVEYFAQGAYEQYGLPYTIARPFNCVGIGESRALDSQGMLSGNLRLAMSHVLPDLIHKVLKGQDPLHILGDGGQVRHYTYGGDIARGIRLCLEHPGALNEDFNLSTARSTSVLELAELVWQKVHGAGKRFRYVSDPALPYDVRRREPAVDKAKRVLGFEATTNLEAVVDEVIPWIAEQIGAGRI